MEARRDLPIHFPATIAYRTQKALRGAPDSFSGFRAGANLRTPHEIVWYMTGVLGYARTLTVSGIKQISMIGLVAYLCTPGSMASGTKHLQITGEKARTLISLLVTGNDSVQASIKDSHRDEIVIRDLSILSESTYKYDPTDPYYKLMVYSAQGKPGATTTVVNIGEATALFHYFRELGITPDLALEGTYLELKQITCTIDPDKSISVPQRFQCQVITNY